MSPLAAEQTELLRALARHGVEFVVVGGVAAQVHGWRGATADLDIAVSTEDSNVERLNLALASVGAGSGTVGAFGTVFAKKYGRLEIVRRAHAIGHYPDWLRGAREHRLGEGLTVVVAAPGDILRSKEAAGREKDRAGAAADAPGLPGHRRAVRPGLARCAERRASFADRLRVGTRWERIASSRGLSWPLVSSREMGLCRKFRVGTGLAGQ
jgi:hypothetical protein